MPTFWIIGFSVVCIGIPAFAETFEWGQQHVSPDDFHQQESLQKTVFSGDSSNLSEHQKKFDEGKFDRGAFDPLNETLPGETGEDGDPSSMAGPESMLPGENAAQFKEDDQEPREREGFLRTLPGGLN